ncbi:MAG: FecR domain-containing protein [Paludibacter sp.]|nr:FecR domain-containing protein [Paludibacter sp.]
MNDQFSQLLSKVLAGEASEIEKESLKQMLLESSEQSLIYNQIKEYWDADVNLTNKSDNESFEDRILSQLIFKPEVQKLKFRKFFLRISSAAAVLFFVMTCAFVYLYTTSSSEFYTYSAQSTPVEYILKDGTKVTLNKNSSLTFKSDYGDKQRNVKLIGEAYFKVIKNKTKPFIVEALGTKTEDLGTSFNLKSNKENSYVTTTLVEGSIRFRADNCNVLLEPGEEIVYNTKSKKSVIQTTDTQYNTAWVSGRFNYVDITFGDLVVKLEHIYKLKIAISNQKIANRIVSASFFNNEPIEDILKALKTEMEFSYIRKNSAQINIISQTLKKQMPM